MKAFKSNQVYYQGELQQAAILVKDGIIFDVIDHDKIPAQAEIHDYENLIIMPGLVDSHVHINEPGRTEWEGFATATQAAAAGGITTVIDMPLNCIPVTTDMSALAAKLNALENQLWVDVGFHGGVIPGNQQHLSPMIAAGIKSFKAFMIDSGVDEFPASDLATLNQAMPILEGGNATLLVHAEIDTSEFDTDKPNDLSSYQAFLNSRPDIWEIKAIESIIELSEKHNCKVHVVHLSSSKAIDLIKRAKEKNIPITSETCPHYLTLSAESIPDGDARFKCCPPIRSQKNQDKLWDGLEKDIIDFIVSDHSPCTPSLKLLEQQNLWEAWGGISSLQFGLSLIWTAIQKRGYGIDELVKWMCEKPAQLVQLNDKKGRISIGHDADFVIWNPNKTQTITAQKTRHKHKASAYEEVKVIGQVINTVLRGEIIYDNATLNFTIEHKPQGKPLL